MILKEAEWRGTIYGRTPNGLEHPAWGVVLHIMGSKASAADNWFHSPKSGDPNAGAGADFGVCNGQSLDVHPGWSDGHLIQWADTDDRAWAQGSGNRNYYSIETEGSGGPLTDAQVATCARLYAELQKLDGFPFTLAEHPGEHGFGWHGMGGAAWGGHDYCPGPERKAQRQHILDLAQHGTTPQPQGDDDMMYLIHGKYGSYTTDLLTGKHFINTPHAQDDVNALLKSGKVVEVAGVSQEFVDGLKEV